MRNCRKRANNLVRKAQAKKKGAEKREDATRRSSGRGVGGMVAASRGEGGLKTPKGNCRRMHAKGFMHFIQHAANPCKARGGGLATPPFRRPLRIGGFEDWRTGGLEDWRIWGFFLGRPGGWGQGAGTKLLSTTKNY